MSAAAIAAMPWAVAARIAALLPVRSPVRPPVRSPVRRPFAPGSVPLPAAPVPIFRPGFGHGRGRPDAALAALVSMFRRPLRHPWRRLRGREEREAEG